MVGTNEPFPYVVPLWKHPGVEAEWRGITCSDADILVSESRRAEKQKMNERRATERDESKQNYVYGISLLIKGTAPI